MSNISYVEQQLKKSSVVFQVEDFWIRSPRTEDSMLNNNSINEDPFYFIDWEEEKAIQMAEEAERREQEEVCLRSKLLYKVLIYSILHHVKLANGLCYAGHLHFIEIFCSWKTEETGLREHGKKFIVVLRGLKEQKVSYMKEMMVSWKGLGPHYACMNLIMDKVRGLFYTIMHSTVE